MKIGQAEFQRCVSFVAQLPHVKAEVQNGSLDIHAQFADVIFWEIKKAIISVVWGELFPDLFKVFFMEIPESQTKQENNSFPKPQALRIPPNVTVASFERINDNHFDLQERYILKLSDGLSRQVVFREDLFIRCLYTDATLYNTVGREFCVRFDIFYAKTGTEAVAESFYRVMSTQEQDGGQKLETLALRSSIDWCLPAVLQCEKPIKEIAKLYLTGDEEQKLKKHNIPIFRNRQTIKNHTEMSKVLTRISTTKPRLPFLL